MNLLELAVRIVADDQATEKIKGMASTVGGGLATAAKVGGAAIAASSAATLAFGKSAVDAGMTFDSSMSQVAATMGKTTDEIGDLRDFAQDMGAKTAFSASQAADALNYMALAGYDSETSMKMLPNVLNLAAAGGMELADASDMVTDAQSALGLSLDETSEMVDKMAKASSTTNTSVSQLGSAILTVGGTAKTLSGGTTELSQALGLLADNGVKGAEGGTALRNIILSLSAPTDVAAKKLQELGVEAFDSEGNMRPLNETFGDLNAALGNLTEQEKTQALNAIFNKVDLKSVNALLGTSAERWDEVAAKIDDSKGAAEAMAQTQLDNLAGDITLMQSALEGFQIAISDGVTPSLRDFVGFAGESLQNFTTSFKEGGIDGLMDAVSEAVEKGVAMIGEKLPGFIEAGGKVLGAVASGLVNAAPTLVVGMGNALADLLNALAEGQDDMMQGGTELLSKLADAVLEVGPKVFVALMNLIGSMLLSIVQHGPEMLEAAGTLLNNVVDAIGIGAGSILEALGVLIGDMLVSVGAEADNMASEFGGLIQAGIDAIGGFLQDMWDAGGNLVQGLIDGITHAPGDIASSLVDTVGGGIDQLKSWLGIASPSKLMRGIGENTVDGFTEGIDGKAAGPESSMLAIANSMANAVQGSVGAAVDAVAAYASSAVSAGESVMGGVSDGVGAKSTDVYDAMLAVASDGLGALGSYGIMTTVAQAGMDIIAGFANGIASDQNSVINALWGGVGGAIDTVKSWLGIASPSKLFAELGGYTMQGFAKGIEDSASVAERAMASAAADVYGAADGSVSVGPMGARAVGSSAPSVTVNIDGDLVVREEADVDRIAEKLALKVSRAMGGNLWNTQYSMA